jgi:hypothetical protein
MQQDAFIWYATPIELCARQRPGWFSWRLRNMLALGRALLWLPVLTWCGMLLVPAGFLTANLLTTKPSADPLLYYGGSAVFGAMFLGILFCLVGAIVRTRAALRVPPPEYHDLPLPLTDYPALQALIERTCRESGAPQPTAVHLNGGAGTGYRVAADRRTQDVLALGLGDLHTLSPAHFATLLLRMTTLRALDPRHRMDDYHRVRAAWQRFFANADTPAWARGDTTGPGNLHKVEDWYMPRLLAHVWAFTRTCSRAADARAAQRDGIEQTAEMHIAVALVEQAAEHRLTDDIHALQYTVPDPPADFYSRMYRILDDIDVTLGTAWLEECLAATTTYMDDDLALADRLALLSFMPAAHGVTELAERLLAPPAESAAAHYLGDSQATWLARLDALFAEREAAAWRARFEAHQQQEDTLETLDTAADERPLTKAEWWERVRLTRTLSDDLAPTLQLLDEMAAAFPQDERVTYARGSLRLEHGDAEGIRLLEDLMTGNPWHATTCCRLIADFLAARGEMSEATLYARRLAEQEKRLALAVAELKSLEVRGKLAPHGLVEAYLAPLRALFEQYPQVERVYLVRNVVKRVAEFPIFVLGLVLAVDWKDHMGHDQADIKRFLNEVHEQVELPGQGTIYHLHPDFYFFFIRRLKRVEGSQIFVRTKPPKPDTTYNKLFS